MNSTAGQKKRVIEELLCIYTIYLEKLFNRLPDAKCQHTDLNDIYVNGCFSFDFVSIEFLLEFFER